MAVGCRPLHGVLITDQRQMLPLMQRNIELNGLKNVKPCVYDWGDARPETVPAHPDVVLGADLVYFEPAFPLLLRTLQDLIGPQTVCYFCFKKRRRADMQFVKTARKLFDVHAVEDDQDSKVYARENIFLYALPRTSSTPGGRKADTDQVYH